MNKQLNSYKTKYSIIIFCFFALMLGTALYMFVNIRRDHSYDRQLKYHTVNAKKINDYKVTFSRLLSYIYEYSAEKNIKNKERYLRLSQISNSQYEHLLGHFNNNADINKHLLLNYKRYLAIKDLADRMFESTDNERINTIIRKIKVYEANMSITTDKMSDRIYSTASSISSERTKYHEELLSYYFVITSILLLISFGMLLYFFSKNVSKPLKQLMKAIKYLDKGDFSHSVEIHANTEFDLLGTSFNDMSNKLGTLTTHLQEKNNRLEAVVNTPAVGVLILNDDQKIIFQNKWANKKLTIKNNISYLKADTDVESIQFKKVKDSSFETYIFEDQDDDGNRYECFMNKMNEETLLLIFDISEKVKLEENLKHYIENIEQIVSDKTKQLHNAYSELEEKNKELMDLDIMKNQFLQNISHELRTPLTSIIGYLDVVLNYSNIPITQRNFLRIALENGLSLQKIINDLLNITDIESGEIKLKLQKVDTSKLLEKIVSQIKIQAEQKKLKLNYKLDKKIAPELFELKVDEKKIRNVINNVISNAIKFTKEGKISISLSANKKSVTIVIKDTGIGIKKEDLGVIFDKFRQVDSSISKAYDGAGLGLPIAKKILEMHQSDISVESEDGKGSTFTIRLNRVFED